MREFAGKTAFVTGGAAGIGLALGKRRVRGPSRIVVCNNAGVTAGGRIGESGRNRPERYGQSQPLDPASPAAALVAEIARNIDAGLEPDAVAARVLTAIRNDELYIFTHSGMRAEAEARFAAILAAMDRVSPP
jgi:NAD(P)-dependent dehydrogenase (short-subunit alcohol dehydrogenase family)